MRPAQRRAWRRAIGIGAVRFMRLHDLGDQPGYVAYRDDMGRQGPLIVGDDLLEAIEPLFECRRGRLVAQRPRRPAQFEQALALCGGSSA